MSNTVENRNLFIAKLAKKHQTTSVFLIQLLRDNGIAYNYFKELEIEAEVDAIFELRRVRIEQVTNKLVDTPQLEKCWLHSVEGINCKGIQKHRRGGLPECSLGGIRHFLVARFGNGDPLAFLKRAVELDAETERVIETGIAEWKELFQAKIPDPFSQDG